MMMEQRDVVVSAYVAYMRKQNNNVEKGRSTLAARGYEIVDCEGPVTHDGRPIFEMYGRRWAMTPTVHARYVDEQILAARAARPVDDAPASEPSCVAIIDGHLCGGTLARALICPKCDLGKHGVAATLVCDVCGAVTAEMRQP